MIQKMLIRKGISSSIIFCLSEAAGPLVALYRLGLISLVISNDTDFIGLGVDNVYFFLSVLTRMHRYVVDCI